MRRIAAVLVSDDRAKASVRLGGYAG